ncbi:gamma-glutamyltransferase [Mesorhizobium waimense]|uniref:Glutathione hydrolase proenzyme n=1 Tax=Mesorhizobium waimense TaxID=1300307 RepID=A0A3A5JY66_9HYPH|nr:gamma-glutamyltransferase [Mesorhizobium waimense]RJT27223.1 gamma-glutamyltransferase [Mesorhizobium waimense]
MNRDFQLSGRSPVIAINGMAATSHPLATLAAVDILRDGGTAADAAVAAVAALCVVEPANTGIGGDCYTLISKPGKPVWGYNGSGRSGANASYQPLRDQGVREIGDSVHSVTVPGAIDAWEQTLKAHGRFGFDRVLRAAIQYAESGFPVAQRVALDWQRHVGKLAACRGAAKHYLFNGMAPKEGDVIRFPALAETLKTIALKGAKGFYEGAVGAEMAATVAARGSFLKDEDFANHRGNTVVPISTEYRGVDLIEIPPNGQGLTALVMLNILENFDLKSLDPMGPERFHLVLEAARIGYAVRDTHLSDADHMRTPVAALTDKAWGKKLASLIDMNKRSELPAALTPGSNTVYISVVDRDRNAVSLINSLYSGFGAGICTERSGVLLTNRGACFTLAPDHPNTFGPAKRPMHTIIPALAMKNGRCEMSFGVMGGHYQPMGHVQILLNMLEYGMDVQQAIDCPRLFWENDRVAVETSIPQRTMDGLRARGHNIVLRDLPWGGAQTVKIDWDRGVLIGGSEPRNDGCALGY